MSKARDIADLDFNAPDIDGGNIDGAVIGATTAAAGSFLTINSGAHLINASSTAFGASSVQGFNTDYLVDSGQGYARHNSYHTGGSNHQFLVNDAGSTTNAVALSIAKDKSATFSSRVSATGSANSGSASHIPALLGSGSYGGGIATRDGAESGWYQQASGADWHFYHNRTVASQTPESKKVLSFNSSGAATFSSSVTATGGLFSSANPLDVRMGTDKRINFSGGIGEIGSVAGFQSLNTAGNALAGFGIRASSIALATSSNTRLLLSDNGAITTTPSSGGHAVFNESSTDADFRVESNGNAHMLFVDGGNNRVGIGGTPGNTLDVHGTATFRTGASTPDATVSTYGKGIEIRGGNMRLNIDVSNVSNGGAYLQTRHIASAYPAAYYDLKLNPLGGFVTVNDADHSNGGLYVKGGIAFDTNDDAHRMDSYEEGTWNPTFSSGVTANTVIGRYTKVGNVVTVMIRAGFSSTTTATNQLTLSLPYVVRNEGALRGGLSIGMITKCTIISSSKIIYAQLDPNFTNVFFRYSNNSASWSAMTPNDMGTNGEIHISGSYLTDA